MGIIVNVVVGIAVVIITVGITAGITNCAAIKRRRKFATSTFAPEMVMQCMGVGVIVAILVVIVTIIRG